MIIIVNIIAIITTANYVTAIILWFLNSVNLGNFSRNLIQRLFLSGFILQLILAIIIIIKVWQNL